MIVYVDKNSHCHATKPDGECTTVEADFFDGKCDAFIEGHCYEIKENGYALYAWKPYEELDNAQREYERQLLVEYEAALENSVPISELEAAYREGVNSAYD